ncbi:MAG: hypothetical protein ACOC9Y_10190 [Chloroflexota bacterium]
MDEPTLSEATGKRHPIEHKSIIIVAGRVVEVETLHVGASAWVATGCVSEPLPSGPFLDSPLEITATGPTEDQAVRGLRRRIEEISRSGAG